MQYDWKKIGSKLALMGIGLSLAGSSVAIAGCADNHDTDNTAANVTTAVQMNEHVYALLGTMGYKDEITGTNYSGYPEMINAREILINQGHVNPEHIVLVTDMDKAKFETAAEKLASMTNNDDTVYIALDGHGNKGSFGFKYSSGSGMPYEEMDKIIDTINSKETVMTLDACYSGSAVPYMTEDNRIFMTQTAADQIGGNAELTKYFMESMIDKNSDYNSDGRVSVSEAYIHSQGMLSDWLVPENNSKPREPQISDPSGLAERTYLMDYNV